MKTSTVWSCLHNPMKRKKNGAKQANCHSFNFKQASKIIVKIKGTKIYQPMSQKSKQDDH